MQRYRSIRVSRFAFGSARMNSGASHPTENKLLGILAHQPEPLFFYVLCGIDIAIMMHSKKKIIFEVFEINYTL